LINGNAEVGLHVNNNCSVSPINKLMSQSALYSRHKRPISITHKKNKTTQLLTD